MHLLEHNEVCNTSVQCVVYMCVCVRGFVSVCVCVYVCNRENTGERKRRCSGFVYVYFCAFVGERKKSRGKGYESKIKNNID